MSAVVWLLLPLVLLPPPPEGHPRETRPNSSPRNLRIKLENQIPSTIAAKHNSQSSRKKVRSRSLARCRCTLLRRPPPLLLLPAAYAHCWRMTATIARRCHCAGAARALSVPRVLPYVASPHPFYTACTLAHARAAHARHNHSSCAGETRRPNQLLSHVVDDVCLALLRLLKMLSKFTESEANKKMMGEKMSGKVSAATSVIASYEERGEGECTHTPVSTTISTAGGPASPSREWPCSSIACDGCDQHAHRPLAVRACRRIRGRTRYGRKTSPRCPSLLVLMETIEATRSKIKPEIWMARPRPCVARRAPLMSQAAAALSTLKPVAPRARTSLLPESGAEL